MFSRLLGVVLILYILWKFIGSLSRVSYERKEELIIRDRLKNQRTDDLLDMDDFLELAREQENNSDGDRS
jgi:hypothetical protein